MHQHIAIYSWNFSHKHLLKLNSQPFIYVHEKKSKKQNINKAKATFSVKTFYFFFIINQLHEKFVKSWFYIWNAVQSFSQKNNDEWKGKILDAMKA